MKRTISSICFAAVLAISNLALAKAEVIRPVVEFEMPPNFFADICKDKVWKGTVAKWGGVVDARETPFIGKQVKKGGEQIPVVPEPALAVVMNDALSDLFQECGMAFVEKAKPGMLSLSAEIKSFDINVIKKTVSNAAASESMVRFVVQKGTGSQVIDVGVELESKGVGGGKLKALKKAANKLLLETLKEIPQNEHMRELAKD